MPYREGFNLFSKTGRENFFRRGILGDKLARHYVIADTFGRFYCRLFGHSKEVFEDNDGNPICPRCYRRIKNA